MYVYSIANIILGRPSWLVINTDTHVYKHKRLYSPKHNHVVINTGTHVALLCLVSFLHAEGLADANWPISTVILVPILELDVGSFLLTLVFYIVK